MGREGGWGGREGGGILGRAGGGGEREGGREGGKNEEREGEKVVKKGEVGR